MYRNRKSERSKSSMYNGYRHRSKDLNCKYLTNKERERESEDRGGEEEEEEERVDKLRSKKTITVKR